MGSSTKNFIVIRQVERRTNFNKKTMRKQSVIANKSVITDCLFFTENVYSFFVTLKSFFPIN